MNNRYCQILTKLTCIYVNISNIQSDILTSILLCYYLISDACALPVSVEKILPNVYMQFGG